MNNPNTGYWLLSRPQPRAPGAIVTQAFVLCAACLKPLAATGGPRDALCDACVEAACQQAALARMDDGG